jgi:hypothetical protein
MPLKSFDKFIQINCICMYLICQPINEFKEMVPVFTNPILLIKLAILDYISIIHSWKKSKMSLS